MVPKIEEALDQPVFDYVDGMEVFNGAAPVWELNLCSVVCYNLPIKGTGGSDSHNIEAVGDCVTVLYNRVSTEEEFCEQMRAGNYYARHRLLDRVYPDNCQGTPSAGE
jgi:hypothetical protein